MARKHAQHSRLNEASSELDKECQAILELLAQEEDEHWQIGVHYNRIVDQRLAQAAGFKNAQEFVSQRLGGISQPTLTLYGTIAKAFPEEVAKKYGSTLLGQLITYEKLSKAQLPKGDPGPITIKVPNKDGSTSNKNFADCSLEQMREAVHQLHSPAKEKPIPAEDRRLIEALEKTMDRQLGGGTPLTMHARRGKPDTLITFNLTIQYLEPLRDILFTVLGKPDNAVAIHHSPAGKNKQMSRRNGQPRGS